MGSVQGPILDLSWGLCPDPLAQDIQCPSILVAVLCSFGMPAFGRLWCWGWLFGGANGSLVGEVCPLLRFSPVPLGTSGGSRVHICPGAG